MELHVVRSTSRGSCTAYQSRTDNVRAHADSVYIARQYGYSKDTICPERVQHILTLTILTVNKPHPGHLPSPQLKTLILNLQDSTRHEQSVMSKRLQYVCTLFPPIARCY